MYKKIILPTDGSEYSNREILRATKLLAEDGEVIILSVATELRKTAFQRSKDIDRANKESIQEAKEYVAAMKKGFDDSVNVRTKVVVGFPAEAINQVAEEEGADLIIIASSGKRGLHRFVIGSVAEKVLKDSEIDVLLVHD
ncbi:universal stress protein UspA2 [Methanobrevibacter ruminantium M1]|uniref:Universal stress protein UspA2 n=1 Tax=Methanobrevibacter ruminantium (strain ATCC 35063 / DSM 1093 / JCM 13430 / OCM 146 / M1) TaxID=634498 RepID=D3E0P5_METRM|nr:universal stress protein [Methanobrevibacter ruminantium]ADC46291.1 universal stress protein UspA2 [Methanobrevibacter ruminantium M1]